MHAHMHTPPCRPCHPATKQIAGLTEELGPGFAGTLFAPSEDAVSALLEELGGAALEPALAREILVRPLPLSLLQFGVLNLLAVLFRASWCRLAFTML